MHNHIKSQIDHSCSYLPCLTTSTTAAMLGFLEVNGAAKDASPVLTWMRQQAKQTKTKLQRAAQKIHVFHRKQRREQESFSLVTPTRKRLPVYWFIERHKAESCTGKVARQDRPPNIAMESSAKQFARVTRIPRKPMSPLVDCNTCLANSFARVSKIYNRSVTRGWPLD